jgi:N-acylneuraminate cytidylyltransferase
VRNSVVALIPARAGSKRLANKNIRVLAGHPVIAYTIAAARESAIFDAIIVSTDSAEYAEIARHYGAEVPFLRPAQLAGDLSPDIEWIEHALGELREQGREFDCFSLLRPTSPFRRSDTIQRAWQLFMSNTGADSLRAVQKCTEHPGKMWVIRGNRMHPLLPFGPKEQPWHSTPYQALPEVYVQNASLEIAWCRVVDEFRTIAGETIVPFITQDVEGLDVNNPSDWDHAEALIRAGAAVLPRITTSQYSNAV